MARDIHHVSARHAHDFDMVRFEFFGPAITRGRATDVRSIEFYGGARGSTPLGQLRYLICHECRRGCVGNIDVEAIVQGRGLATRALARVREPLAGYLWRTSLHLPDAEGFWRLMAERTGEDYADIDRTCEHMEPFWKGGVTYAADNHELEPEWFQLADPNPNRR